MLRRVDILGLIAASMVIAALVCFLGGNILPFWVVYLGGPMLWFFGTVVAIVWMVCRFFPASPVASDQPTSLPSGQTPSDQRNMKRAALLIIAGVLPLLLRLSANAADGATAIR